MKFYVFLFSMLFFFACDTGSNAPAAVATVPVQTGEETQIENIMYEINNLEETLQSRSNNVSSFKKDYIGMKEIVKKQNIEANQEVVDFLANFKNVGMSAYHYSNDAMETLTLTRQKMDEAVANNKKMTLIEYQAAESNLKFVVDSLGRAYEKLQELNKEFPPLVKKVRKAK